MHYLYFCNFKNATAYQLGRYEPYLISYYYRSLNGHSSFLVFLNISPSLTILLGLSIFTNTSHQSFSRSVFILLFVVSIINLLFSSVILLPSSDFFFAFSVHRSFQLKKRHHSTKSQVVSTEKIRYMRPLNASASCRMGRQRHTFLNQGHHLGRSPGLVVMG